MICEDALPLIYDLVDGEISKNEQLVLNAHLASCKVCAAKLTSIQKADQYYRQAMPVSPAPQLAAQITQFVAKASTQQTAEPKLKTKVIPLVNAKVTSKSVAKPTNAWTTTGLILRLSGVAASLAIFFYGLGIVANKLAFTPDTTTSLDPGRAAGWQELTKLFNNIPGVSQQVMALLAPVSQSALAKDLLVVLLLICLQLITSYVLMRPSQKKGR